MTDPKPPPESQAAPERRYGCAFCTNHVVEYRMVGLKTLYQNCSDCLRRYGREGLDRMWLGANSEDAAAFVRACLAAMPAEQRAELLQPCGVAIAEQYLATVKESHRHYLAVSRLESELAATKVELAEAAALLLELASSGFIGAALVNAQGAEGYPGMAELADRVRLWRNTWNKKFAPPAAISTCWCSDYQSSGVPCPPGKCPNAPATEAPVATGERCPRCGAPEVEASTPRTTYACGSSDYDQRPGTFDQKCDPAVVDMGAPDRSAAEEHDREAAEILRGLTHALSLVPLLLERACDGEQPLPTKFRALSLEKRFRDWWDTEHKEPKNAERDATTRGKANPSDDAQGSPGGRPTPPGHEAGARAERATAPGEVSVVPPSVPGDEGADSFWVIEGRRKSPGTRWAPVYGEVPIDGAHPEQVAKDRAVFYDREISNHEHRATRLYRAGHAPESKLVKDARSLLDRAELPCLNCGRMCKKGERIIRGDGVWCGMDCAETDGEDWAQK